MKKTPPALPPELPITAEDWVQTPVSVQMIVIALHQQVLLLGQQVVSLQAEVAELREQLNRNSRNSSQPPSSDGPAQQPPKQEPVPREKKRRRGGQPGHAGHQRKLLPPEKVDRVETCKPHHCAGCGAELVGEDPAPYRYQTVEIPPPKVIVTEYQVHTVNCSECGALNRGEIPAEAADSPFGPNLMALVAVWMGQFRQSKRQVVAQLKLIYDLDVSAASVVHIQKRVSAALVEPVEAAREAVKDQPARYIDETGWQDDWLWTVVTSVVSVFLIVKSRASHVAKALLGETSRGVATTDRAGAYSWLDPRIRQVCWAHLMRDFQKILERGGDSYRIGENLRIQGDYLLHRWRMVREGELSHAEVLAELPTLQEAVHHWLTEGAVCTHSKTAHTCRNLLSIEAALWTFATHPEVEPTNNAAERALRHPVIWRRTSYGTQSESGSRFVERILTVIATCRQQSRDPLAFVRAALLAQRAGLPAPSLLPVPDP
jgi:transposase